MFSLHSYFEVIPCETAVTHFAAEGHRVEMSDFCNTIGFGVVNILETHAAPALRRPVGRPGLLWDMRRMMRLCSHSLFLAKLMSLDGRC